MTTPGAHRVAFHALKNLNRARRGKPWNITELYPGKEKSEILEILADYYNKISAEFPPLTINDKHVTYSREMREITPAEIKKGLVKFVSPKVWSQGTYHPI